MVEFGYLITVGRNLAQIDAIEVFFNGLLSTTRIVDHELDGGELVEVERAMVAARIVSKCQYGGEV